jgi:hypothetical protein
VSGTKRPYIRQSVANGYPSSNPHMFQLSNQMHNTIDPQFNRVDNEKPSEDEDEDGSNKKAPHRGWKRN